MGRALLVLGLCALGAPAGAQVEAWPAPPVRAPQEDAPEAPDLPQAPVTALATAPGSGPQPGPALGAAPTPAPAAPAEAPLLLPDLDGPARSLLVLLVLLVAYLGPALLYPGLLGATALGPGKAAAVCLGLGAALTLPGLLLVLARARFVGGEPVAWFAQSAHYPLAAGGAALLLALAALASRARGAAE